MKTPKPSTYKAFLFGIIGLIATLICIKLDRPEPAPRQPEQLQFVYKPMKELDGDSIRVYYTSFGINSNGRFDTWETKKVYLP